jgi:nucleoside-diphosphate-sugar epimerase
MKVLVAGGSGVVGRQLVPQLVERGHDVAATTTKPHNLEVLRALGARPVLLDGLDGAAVGETIAKIAPDAIINEMTALAGAPDFRHFDRWFARTNELRRRGTENLLAAARASGVARFVTQSYTGWTIDDEGPLVATEDAAFDPDPLPAQRATLEAIRAMESMVLAAPLDGIVVRYANLYGPKALEASTALLRRRRFPIIGAGDGVWSWLHVEDAASATVAALERGVAKIYNAADDEPAPVRDWLPYLARIVGAPKPTRVPTWLGRILAGDVVVRMMTRSRGVSNAKAKAELGWQPSWASWRAGFAALVSASEPGRARATGTRRSDLRRDGGIGGKRAGAAG